MLGTNVLIDGFYLFARLHAWASDVIRNGSTGGPEFTLEMYSSTAAGNSIGW